MLQHHFIPQFYNSIITCHFQHVPHHFAAQEYIFDMLPAAPSIISLANLMPKHPLTMVLPTHSSNNPNCHFNSCNNTLLMLFQRSWMKTKKGLVVDKEF
jgi:hypothetical protein